MTIEELTKACSGELIISNSNRNIKNIVIDSRKATRNDVFVSIKGENLDGHCFISTAYNNGCKAFIISDITYLPLIFDKDDIDVILVNDTQLAMGEIAFYYKNKFNIPYIGVTGSVGKTTTRDMIHSALSGKYNTHKNVGNLNNHLGVPLTLFELNKEHECAVIEMGMSHFGEIEYLADIVCPDISIISNIGLSHVENLGSQEGILKAKLEITKNFSNNHLLIINGDDKFLSTLKNKKLSYQLKTFGFNPENDIYCKEYSLTTENTSFTCVIDEKDEFFEIPALGEHNILNAMCAILVGLELGLDIDEIKKGLSTYSATGMRLDIIRDNKFTIINDCYNASPDSMDSALKVLNTFNTARKVAILGDMFEMGDMAEIGHRQVGSSVVKNADLLITIGKDSKFIKDEALSLGFNKEKTYHYNTKGEFFFESNKILKRNDAILVKASRGMKLEDVVNHIKEL